MTQETGQKLTRRPRSSVGGLALRLDAPEKPGMVRRFVNATPKRLREMEDLGYVPVQGAAEGKARTDGLGSGISRFAGTEESGAPLQTVLMETPVELYEQGLKEREESRKAFDDTIRRGMDPTGEAQDAYAPTTRSTLSG